MHQKTLPELYKIFQTSEKGLNEKEVQKKMEEYGENIIQVKKKKSWVRAFLEEFADLMVIILIAAAIIAGIANEPTDAAVIMFIVFLNATIGFLQKYKAEKALEALQKMLSPHAKVIREGKVKEIEARFLVPGDIILLSEGDKIPADARLLEERELQVDESPLTGESVPVEKNVESIQREKVSVGEKINTVFMGTAVTHGTAKALVIGIGMKTEFGQIANLTGTTVKDKSPLQKELFKIGVFVGKITLVISLIVLAIEWLWQGKEFVQTLLFATSIAVAAVPEGLPATVTIALAIGVQRLAQKKSIMKKLTSVETLGSTTVICSDKTGTLTKNEMTVVEAYVNGENISISGSGYHPEGKWANTKSIKSIEALCLTAVLCNNSKWDQNKEGEWRIIGDPTEGSLLVASSKAGLSLEGTLEHFKRIDEMPFDSTRKMMTTIHENEKTKARTAHLKGAPDEVLKICTHLYEKGAIVKLTPEKRKQIETMTQKMAKKALRVLAFATRELKGEGIPKGKKGYSKALVETDMVFLGLMGMMDPARPEIEGAVQIAKKAGIKIIMVTGDHGITALAIAQSLGIVTTRDARVILGTELEEMSETKLSQLLSKKNQEILFARVSPEHKLKIVGALKKNGEIVAMTGDGVNDAPALKRADIGIAMGITGTDVSKEAADMILVDDSFGTIVNAVEEGRTIYQNLKKFVFFIFSCNIGELVTVFTGILLGIPAPLTAILILCVNLGTDVLPALALGVDPPEPGIMTKKPRSQKDHIMKKRFVWHFTYLGFVIGGIVLAAYLWTLYRYGWSWGMNLGEENLIYLKASTSAFVLLVFVQMANAMNCRSLSQSIFTLGLFSNRWLWGAILTSIVTIILFVEIPFFQKALHTTSLSLQEWLMLSVLGLSIILVEELRKIIQSKLYSKEPKTKNA
ncbi:MAG: hypothetical protein ACD_28C00032G0009 [uncultured bacterium]|nr:MAG: hypothetical protein ACD_28C00032G0009 [uncultured bacterium]KKT74911.1 MAG: ATPase, P-type (Transporting), HAD superfamily, subfamily IC [Candidatus Peregrinibacteria bacterium GW2011_GWA2_44_7]